MIVLIYTVYDSAIEAYLPPFFAPTEAAAIRTFSNAVNAADSRFKLNAGDFTLFHIGEYDDQSAKLQAIKALKSLGPALQYLKSTHTALTVPLNGAGNSPDSQSCGTVTREELETLRGGAS